MMPRIAGVVSPGVPHNITQRGDRRQQTFFCDEAYRDQLAQWATHWGVEVWACQGVPTILKI